MAKDDNEKSNKREAQALREEARAAFERGDYREARALNARIVALAHDSELGRKASQTLQQLRIEPLALYLGGAAVVLYVTGWAFALW